MKIERSYWEGAAEVVAGLRTAAKTERKKQIPCGITVLLNAKTASSKHSWTNVLPYSPMRVCWYANLKEAWYFLAIPKAQGVSTRAAVGVTAIVSALLRISDDVNAEPGQQLDIPVVLDRKNNKLFWSSCTFHLLIDYEEMMLQKNAQLCPLFSALFVDVWKLYDPEPLWIRRGSLVPTVSLNLRDAVANFWQIWMSSLIFVEDSTVTRSRLLSVISLEHIRCLYRKMTESSVKRY